LPIRRNRAARLPAALVFFIPYLPPSIQLGMTGIQLQAILISISFKIREFGVTEAEIIQ
jgi:hypothetical protein